MRAIVLTIIVVEILLLFTIFLWDVDVISFPDKVLGMVGSFHLLFSWGLGLWAFYIMMVDSGISSFEGWGCTLRLFAVCAFWAIVFNVVLLFIRGEPVFASWEALRKGAFGGIFFFHGVILGIRALIRYDRDQVLERDFGVDGSYKLPY